eukprot:TRINITY_DN12912_c0_g1_i2.p1 TRINITY_DN12912_c0_g1~~TRINITY_DN12912_c0_g1_i2.p1  ORF type:complete len:580 (+),score=111.74 TRINITY_DN12912_c0_g1_i2:42-1781(+)
MPPVVKATRVVPLSLPTGSVRVAKPTGNAIPDDVAPPRARPPALDDLDDDENVEGSGGDLDKSKQPQKLSDEANAVMQELVKDKKHGDKHNQELVERAEALLRHGDTMNLVRSRSMRPGASIARSLTNFDHKKLNRFQQPLFNLLSRKSFDIFVGLVIVLNGVTIGIQADYRSKLPEGCRHDGNICKCDFEEVLCHDIPGWLDPLDICLTVFYCWELGCRFFVFGLSVLKSNWIKLDAALVASSLVEPIIAVLLTSAKDTVFLNLVIMLRLLRLTRLARAVRLISLFRTLWMLVQGLIFSVLTLVWTVLLLSILLYVFAVLGCEIIEVDFALPMDHPYNQAVIQNFKNLVDTVLFMFQMVSWDSIGGVYRPLIEHQFHYFWYVMGVLLVLSIALMNLITAVMVDGCLENAEKDKDAMKAYEAEKKKKQMEILKKMFTELDEDGSGELSLSEIEGAPEAIREQLVEVAGTSDIKSLFEVLDYDGGGLVSTEEFCEGVIKATSSNKPIELDRLVKQCSEILRNHRQAVALLRGEDPEDEKKDEVDSDEGNRGLAFHRSAVFCRERCRRPGSAWCGFSAKAV